MSKTEKDTQQLRITLSKKAMDILIQKRQGYEKPGDTISRIVIEDHLSKCKDDQITKYKKIVKKDKKGKKTSSDTSGSFDDGR